MTEFQTITFEIKGHVAEIFLNRPQKSNAMNPPFWPEIEDVFKKIHLNPEIRAVLVAGNGKNFSAGLDLMESAEVSMSQPQEETRELVSLYEHVLKLQESFNVIDECKKPVIAAVHGACVGGALDMISACDIRVCSQDAFFSLREARLAIIADLGSLNRLPSIIGPGHTRELAFTAKNIDAQRALQIGLVNDVYADRDACIAAARKLANEISAMAPLAVQGAKEVMNYCRHIGPREGQKYAAARSCLILKANDLMEAVASFLEKRAPDFKGQ